MPKLTDDQKKKILAEMQNDAKSNKASNKGVYNYAKIWSDNFLDVQKMFANHCSNANDFVNMEKGKEHLQPCRNKLRAILDNYNNLIADKTTSKEQKLQTLIKLQLFFENYGGNVDRLTPNVKKEYMQFIAENK